MSERAGFRASAQEDGGRLNSWKDIAAYLGREQRTVQRWEASEGLPVHRLRHGKADSVYALRSELDEWLSRRSTRLPPPAAGGARQRAVRVAGVAAVVLIALAGGFVASRRAAPEEEAPVPFTSDPGIELEPQLSPDGARVAFAWNGEAGDNFDVYVRPAAGGTTVRLTTSAENDHSPAWSPDGLRIAFLRRTAAGTAAVLVVPSAGGAERRVAEVRAAAWDPWSRPGPSLAWSRDAKWLVASVAGSERRDALVRIGVESGELRQVTWPPDKTMGDMAPALSPDGRTIAFSRLLSWGKSELCALPVSADVLPAGEVRVLATGSTWNASPAWSPDGRGLVFSTGSMEATHLARLDMASATKPERLRGRGDYGWMPSLSRGPDRRLRMVYTQHFESVNIWRDDVEGGAGPASIVVSAHRSYEPAWSRDGRRIVFISDRTGYSEIWAADADGRRAEQWTNLRQPRLGSPRWSPDGRRIAFTAPGKDGSTIHVVEAPNGSPKPVPGSEDSGYLDWTADGRAIYFSSNRGGRYDIWKVPAEGGQPARVTYNRGRVPVASSDGRFLYYLKLAGEDGRNDLWRLPLAGGAEEKVLDFVDAYSLSDNGIAIKYYRPGAEPAGPYLEFYDFADRRTRRLPSSSKPLRYGIALSPEGRQLLYSQADYQLSDLMLVDGLR